MVIYKAKDYQDMSRKAANIISAQIIMKPNCVLGLATGFEYSLVAGVNDQPDDIRELTAILKRRNCHLNLIPVNPIKERDFKKPDRKNALEFKNKLEKNGINVTIRRERGSDIDGACGQLRRRHAAKSEGETDENICND